MVRFNIIVPYSNELSSEEKGILATMLNNPEDDYCTAEELHKTLSADTLDTIRSTLEQLVMKKYVIKLKGYIYAVNKKKILNMKLI